MSKRKIWNVNEKKHYKMYKNGKQWFFAGMGIVAGLFGAGSTTIASADETPKGANLDLSKSKNLLATKTSATIPGSTSNTNSQNVNSTHNSVTNSASTANQNTQASASQSASKAASASLSASLKASQAASQQKASQSKSQQAADQASDQAKQASEKAKQQAAKTDTKKASNNSQQHSQADSHQDSTNQQSKSVTKQSTNNGSQANADNRQGSTSGTGSNTKIETSQNDIQNSQSLSIANSVADSVKQSQSLVADKQSLSISQSLVDSMSKSTEKINSSSTDETPIHRPDTYIDGETGDQIFANDDDWRDTEDAIKIIAPRTDPHYVLDLGETEISIAMDGEGSGQPLADFKNAFLAYAKTATSIDDLNKWIKNSDYYKKYIDGNETITSVKITWHYKKQNDQTKLVGQDITTTVGKEVDITEGIAEFTDANGQPGNTSYLSWGAGMFSGLWDRAGDYPVTIVYYDPATLQTKTVDITIHVTTNINITGKNGSTYAGVPKDIGDFVDTLTNTEGDNRTPGDDDVDLSWDSSKINWNKAGSYNVKITYEDLTTKETASTTVTITVVENKEDISGQDITYKIGDTHPTLKDLVPDAHMADGTEVTDPSQFTSNLEDPGIVDWNTPNSYKVKIYYLDQLTGKKLETTVVVTVLPADSKGHIEAHNVDTWQGQPLDPSEAVDKLYDSRGNEITDPAQISSVTWNMHKDDWNNPNVYENITLTYVDQYGVIITKTITVTVKEDDTAISGHDDSVIAGNAPSFSDLINNVTTADGTVIDDKGQLNDLITNGDIISTNFDDIDWSQVGTHDIEITYKDPTSGKEVTTTVTVTDDVNSISQSESNADSVSKSGSDSVSKSTSGSDSVSKSTSGSESISTSGSDSVSTSGSDSISASGSDSISKSTSGSESVSGSGSDSISKSISGSGSDSVSASGSDSISKSTSGSESISTSGSGSDSISKSTSGSDSLSKSTSDSDSMSRSASGSDSISKSTSGSDSISKSTSGSSSVSASGSDSLSRSASDSDSASKSASISDSASKSDSRDIASESRSTSDKQESESKSTSDKQESESKSASDKQESESKSTSDKQESESQSASDKNDSGSNSGSNSDSNNNGSNSDSDNNGSGSDSTDNHNHHSGDGSDSNSNNDDSDNGGSNNGSGSDSNNGGSNNGAGDNSNDGSGNNNGTDQGNGSNGSGDGTWNGGAGNGTGNGTNGGNGNTGNGGASLVDTGYQPGNGQGDGSVDLTQGNGGNGANSSNGGTNSAERLPQTGEEDNASARAAGTVGLIGGLLGLCGLGKKRKRHDEE